MNFSQYQTLFTEWEELTKETVISNRGPISGETIEQLRGRSNAGRVKASEEELNSSGT